MSKFDNKNYDGVVIPMSLLNNKWLLQKPTPTNSNESVLFMLIVQLHVNKRINDQSLSALFNNLKQGKLDRWVNTYHCTYNDKWYGDESMLDILIDVVSELNPQDIPIQQMIYYVNRYLNKPRNYCIDYIISNFILPLINRLHWCDYDSLYGEVNLLKDFNLSYLPNVQSYDNYSPSGYCCEDCDGNYNQYKYSQYKHYVLDQAIKDIKKVFKTYFDNLRDESFYRNPCPVNLLD